MKFLVTNDDGIDSDGIGVLSEVAAEFGEVIVVAPLRHHSGCSHQMTFEGHIDAHRVSANRFWVDGFPADCSRLALAQICPDPDVVLSGINHGSNLGLDNYLSGTVAAAREATFWGKPAIAFSQYHRGLSRHSWEMARIMTRRVLAYLLDGRTTPGTYWNVNFPSPDRNEDPSGVPIIECPLDRTPLPNDYSPNERGYTYDGDYHARKYLAGTDVDICMKGSISATLITG
jgi:5'-nucleotidase